jgi:hypothetical protein
LSAFFHSGKVVFKWILNGKIVFFRYE